MNILPTIICVDDEQIILNTLFKQLSFFTDHEIELAQSGAEALEIIEEINQSGGSVHLIISDQIMPDMSGGEFLSKVFLKDESITTILLTGHSTEVSTINLINHTNLFRYIEKPWSENDLILSIREGLLKKQAIDRLRANKETFEKFVPKEFLSSLNIKYEDSESIKEGILKTLKATILFTDIRGFTSISEKESMSVMVPKLNELMATFARCTKNNNGFVDKYIGDSIMSIFSYEDQQNGASNAIKAAIDMHKKLQNFNHKNNCQWKIGTGIATNEVTMTIIGSDDCLSTTVVGDAVNIASRLEGLTKDYQEKIIVDKLTYDNVTKSEQKILNQLALSAIRGRKGKIEIYSPNKSDNIEGESSY